MRKLGCLFFALLRKYWPDCPFNIYLNTESTECVIQNVITIKQEIELCQIDYGIPWKQWICIAIPWGFLFYEQGQRNASLPYNLEEKEYRSEKTVSNHNYGLDLLKIVLTLLIVAGHFTLHGVKTLNAPLYEEYYISMLGIASASIPAVNVFFHNRIKSKVLKFFKLINQCISLGLGLHLPLSFFLWM